MSDANHINLSSSRYTLIPTSVILGMGGSPLWSAKCTLLTICGNLQAPKENKAAADVINKYFGIFFLIFQSSAVWGNLMSSLIFGSDSNSSKKEVHTYTHLRTHAHTEQVQVVCESSNIYKLKANCRLKSIMCSLHL